MTSARPRSIGLETLRGQLLAACLSGVLYFVAYPGVGWWPLGFIALVPLLVALRRVSTRRALLLGWSSGFVMTLLGFYWLLPLLRQFGGFSWPVCAILGLLLGAYHAGRMGLTTWLCAQALARGWPFSTSFGAAFLASELAFPVLFPWYFGAALHDQPKLIQIADLGGVVLVSGLLVAVNLGASELLLAALARRRPRAGPLLGAVTIPALAWLYSTVRSAQVEAALHAAPSALVGVIQANASVGAKTRESLEQGLTRHLTLTRELLRGAEPAFVVWPETAAPRAVLENDAAGFFRAALESLRDTPILFGAVLARPTGAGRFALSNSALLLDARAPKLERYDKQQLLMFGEYLPFADLVPALYRLSPQSGRFERGLAASALKLGPRPIAATICYEDLLPDFVNDLVRGSDAELLVNLSNDAWFGDTTEPWIHLALAQFRSVEQRRYQVRANNSGQSALIDPLGQVVHATQPFTQASFVAPIRWLSLGTLFSQLGRLAGLLLVVGIFMGGAWGRINHSKADLSATWPVE